MATQGVFGFRWPLWVSGMAFVLMMTNGVFAPMNRQDVEKRLKEEFEGYLNKLERHHIEPNHLDEMKQQSVRGTVDDLDRWYDSKNRKLKTSKTKYEVVDDDTLATAVRLGREGYNPAVLNMANRNNPCGGVLKGALSQEEEICRKSTLSFALMPKYNPRLSPHGKYQIRHKGYIYSPHVEITKTRPLPTKDVFLYKDYVNLYPKFPTTGVITAAMVDLRKDKPKPRDYEDIVRMKIRMAVLAPLRHGHDAAVFGAWGCGAFKNDRNLIARIFREELDKYGKYYRSVSFAIVVASRHDEHNLDAFRSVFKDLISSSPRQSSIQPRSSRRSSSSDDNEDSTQRNSFVERRIVRRRDRQLSPVDYNWDVGLPVSDGSRFETLKKHKKRPSRIRRFFSFFIPCLREQTTD